MKCDMAGHDTEAAYDILFAPYQCEYAINLSRTERTLNKYHSYTLTLSEIDNVSFTKVCKISYSDSF